MKDFNWYQLTQHIKERTQEINENLKFFEIDWRKFSDSKRKKELLNYND